MLKFLVIVAAAGLFLWFVYPEFSGGQSLLKALVAWYE
jgi:hypothetical protein